MTDESPPEPPSVSVIIPNYNGKKFLADCIDSALAQTLEPYEILVVDNDSTDGSVELVREKYPGVKLVEMGANTGFSCAANAGIRQSSGEFIALLNNDAVADRRWLEKLIRPCRENEKIGMCASKMLFLWDKSLINNAGIGLTDYGLPYDRGFYLPDSDSYAEDCFVFGACGGAALLRRAMLDRIGLFEEDFFLCYDDADLSFRAQLMGYQCIYVADAVVLHAGGGTVPYHGETARYYSCRHYIVVITKNMPGEILRRRFGAMAWFCLKNTARSMLEHKDFTNLRGYLSGVLSIPRFMKLRKQIRSASTISADHIRSMMVSKSQMLQETKSDTGS